MLIILTSERELENEAGKINKLFDSGLEILHFRKPTLDVEGYRTFLNQIDTKYYNRIMIHQFHELCEEFNLRGIHIQEQPRLDLEEKLEEYINNYKTKGYKVSSSFHSKEDIKNCSVNFEYVLLSPVFSSISKVGYTGKGFDVTDLNEFVIGMGGINENTLQATFDLGYRGIGVLGGIWNTEDSLKSFKIIYDKLKTIQIT
ncbi:thiamine phosphate synthase [Aquimarina sp. AU58]|uniref:thiamine phosphate synthase n=1 Tax=Aquimarina sp. AU58 TaxID=1874112 RepID=UPI000D6573DB|nr:thiamine phosphate synthase [Aquimarina sp. AU58]